MKKPMLTKKLSQALRTMGLKEDSIPSSGIEREKLYIKLQESGYSWNSDINEWENGETKQILVQLNSDLFLEIEHKAKKQKMTVAQYIATLCEDETKEERVCLEAYCSEGYPVKILLPKTLLDHLSSASQRPYQQLNLIDHIG